MTSRNHVISLTKFFSNANPKWPVIVTFSNSSGVVWTENSSCVFRVKPPFFYKLLRCTVDRGPYYKTLFNKSRIIRFKNLRPSKTNHMFLVRIAIKKRVGGRFFLFFILSYCMLSLHIITFPQGYVEALTSNIKRNIRYRLNQG